MQPLQLSADAEPTLPTQAELDKQRVRKMKAMVTSCAPATSVYDSHFDRAMLKAMLHKINVPTAYGDDLPDNIHFPLWFYIYQFDRLPEAHATPSMLLDAAVQRVEGHTAELIAAGRCTVDEKIRTLLTQRNRQTATFAHQLQDALPPYTDSKMFFALTGVDFGDFSKTFAFIPTPDAKGKTVKIDVAKLEKAYKALVKPAAVPATAEPSIADESPSPKQAVVVVDCATTEAISELTQTAAGLVADAPAEEPKFPKAPVVLLPNFVRAQAGLVADGLNLEHFTAVCDIHGVRAVDFVTPNWMAQDKLVVSIQLAEARSVAMLQDAKAPPPPGKKQWAGKAEKSAKGNKGATRGGRGAAASVTDPENAPRTVADMLPLDASNTYLPTTDELPLEAAGRLGYRLKLAKISKIRFYHRADDGALAFSGTVQLDQSAVQSKFLSCTTVTRGVMFEATFVRAHGDPYGRWVDIGKCSVEPVATPEWARKITNIENKKCFRMHGYGKNIILALDNGMKAEALNIIFSVVVATLPEDAQCVGCLNDDHNATSIALYTGFSILRAYIAGDSGFITFVHCDIGCAMTSLFGVTADGSAPQMDSELFDYLLRFEMTQGEEMPHDWREFWTLMALRCSDRTWLELAKAYDATARVMGPAFARGVLCILSATARKTGVIGNHFIKALLVCLQGMHIVVHCGSGGAGGKTNGFGMRLQAYAGTSNGFVEHLMDALSGMCVVYARMVRWYLACMALHPLNMYLLPDTPEGHARRIVDDPVMVQLATASGATPAQMCLVSQEASDGAPHNVERLASLRTDDDKPLAILQPLDENDPDSSLVWRPVYLQGYLKGACMFFSTPGNLQVYASHEEMRFYTGNNPPHKCRFVNREEMETDMRAHGFVHGPARLRDAQSGEFAAQFHLTIAAHGAGRKQDKTKSGQQTSYAQVDAHTHEAGVGHCAPLAVQNLCQVAYKPALPIDAESNARRGVVCVSVPRTKGVTHDFTQQNDAHFDAAYAAHLFEAHFPADLPKLDLQAVRQPEKWPPVVTVGSMVAAPFTAAQLVPTDPEWYHTHCNWDACRLLGNVSVVDDTPGGAGKVRTLWDVLYERTRARVAAKLAARRLPLPGKDWATKHIAMMQESMGLFA